MSASASPPLVPDAPGTLGVSQPAYDRPGTTADSGPDRLACLRRRIAAIGADGGPRAWDGPRARVPLGHAGADRRLGGGLQPGALHEVRPAAPGDMAAAAGFALALMARLLGRGCARPPGLWLWVRQDLAGRETGEPYGPGLAAFGLDPAALLLVAAGDARETLRAAEEGLRCRSLAGVLLEPWGQAKALDLTAMRRLALAAEGSDVTLLMLRSGTHDERAAQAPGGALTRWRIAAAASAPQPVLGGLPGLGRPAFSATLLRNRQAGGLGEGMHWIMEWSPDEHHLAAPPAPARPGPVAAADGSAAPAFPHGDAAIRRAG